MAQAKEVLTFLELEIRAMQALHEHYPDDQLRVLLAEAIPHSNGAEALRAQAHVIAARITPQDPQLLVELLLDELPLLEQAGKGRTLKTRLRGLIQTRISTFVLEYVAFLKTLFGLPSAPARLLYWHLQREYLRWGASGSGSEFFRRIPYVIQPDWADQGKDWWEVDQIALGVAQELVQLGLIERRQCDEHAYELTVTERYKLIQRHRLASKWNRSHQINDEIGYVTRAVRDLAALPTGD